MTTFLGTPFAEIDTLRPFFGDFLYKASVPNTIDQRIPEFKWDFTSSYSKAVAPIRAAKERIEREIETYVLTHFKPFFDAREMQGDCDYRCTKTFHSFYFADQSDFDAFIAEFDGEVSEVHRPAEGTDFTALDTNYAIERSFGNPFMGSYPIRVAFHAGADESIDSWVEAMFGEDAERHHYNPNNKTRALYLTDEIDLALVKMSHFGQIQKIQQKIAA